jgi:hypothetical protein
MKIYIVVNFKVHGINQNIHKLIWTLILIKQNLIFKDYIKIN